MKKVYKSPEMEIVLLEEQNDIVTASKITRSSVLSIEDFEENSNDSSGVWGD